MPRSLVSTFEAAFFVVCFIFLVVLLIAVVDIAVVCFGRCFCWVVMVGKAIDLAGDCLCSRGSSPRMVPSSPKNRPSANERKTTTCPLKLAENCNELQL